MKLPLTYAPTTPEPVSKSQLKREAAQRKAATQRLEDQFKYDPNILGVIMEIPIDDGQCCVTEDKKE